jgi:Rrf2 family transcriptional regulator, nitric oxide-sensitive transcriptional repressor
MRLTSFTDYCLRVLTYVGAKGDTLSTIDEISDAYGISRNHVMKVVYRLGQLRYLETIRGKTGGMRLLRDPETINLGRLVRDMEENLDLVECMAGGDCCIEPACALKGILNESLKAFLSVLDRYTLSDLLRPQKRLITLLSIPA